MDPPDNGRDNLGSSDDTIVNYSAAGNFSSAYIEKGLAPLNLGEPSTGQLAEILLSPKDSSRRTLDLAEIP